MKKSLAPNFMPKIVRRSLAILDEDWYLSVYPDVAHSRLDARSHFLQFGFSEGRNPNALFDTDWYRHHYQLKADENCLEHYLVTGFKIGNEPSVYFESEWYRSQSGISRAEVSPLEHYCLDGWKRHFDPHPLFDSVWYLDQHPEGIETKSTPYTHFIHTGWKQNLSPSPLFMPGTYLDGNPDVATATMNPYFHFITWGRRESRTTSALVDSDFYKLQYPDDILVHKWGSEAHFARFGYSEDRRISSDPLAQRILSFAALRASVTRKFATLDSFGESTMDPINWVKRAESISIRHSSNPRVSILIPTFNHAGDVIRCVESIAMSGDVTPYEIIVIDDSSDLDESRAMAGISGINLLRLNENRGFAGACAAGVEASSAELILLLNNDTEVLPGWLDSLVNEMDDHKATAIAGSMILRADHLLQEAGAIIWSNGTGCHYASGAAPTEGFTRYRREVDYCSGASLLIRRSVWDEIGGFDPELAPAYYEDVDLCFAVRRLGWSVVYVPGSAIVHREGSSHGKGSFGLKRKQFVNREKFIEKWSKELTTSTNATAVENWTLLPARDRRQEKHVLICDHQHLDVTSDAGSVRMDAMLRGLVDLGFTVHFYPLGLFKNYAWVDSISKHGVEVLESSSDLADFLNVYRNDLSFAIVSRPSVLAELSSAFSLYAPRVPLAFDMVDAHGLRIRRRAELTGDSRHMAESHHIQAVEAKAARLADVTIAVSQSDVDYITSAANMPVKTVVIPTIHRSVEVTAGFESRNGLLFIGGFQHDPNIDAVLWLTHEILPRVQAKLGPIKLTVVGSNATAEILNLRSESVNVLGWVQDLEPIYRSTRLVVAPLRYGAGVKGKIGEALSHHVPVVTTTVGVEGYNLQAGRDILVADSADSIAAEIVRIYDDREMWDSLSTNGAKAVEESVGSAALHRMLQDLVIALSQPKVSTK